MFLAYALVPVQHGVGQVVVKKLFLGGDVLHRIRVDRLARERATASIRCLGVVPIAPVVLNIDHFTFIAVCVVKKVLHFFWSQQRQVGPDCLRGGVDFAVVAGF